MLKVKILGICMLCTESIDSPGYHVLLSQVPKQELIVEDRGVLHLGLCYSSENQALVLSVIAARNVACHSSQQCESYVKW